MRRTTLGRTGIEVSELCLGTMTWGSQNTEGQGHAQIEQALEAGCDFLDTAEVYPTNPVSPETVGDTERIVGTWLAQAGRRESVTVATKISGPTDMIRDGRGIDGASLAEAAEGSLRRLQTDVIDLYQLHSPNRGSYHFRRYWSFDPTGQDTAAVRANIDEVAAAMGVLIEAGKVRAWGLSNETAWGLSRWCEAADRAGAPRPATLQNEYSLICRIFDTDLAETCHHEGVTLLAYSPLAAGLLTGKYQGGAVPPGSRMSRTPDLGGRKTERAFAAVDAYLRLAAEHGLDPAQMAIAWVRARPVPTLPIIGATSPEQLATCLGAADTALPEAIREAVAELHRAHPMPF